MLVLYYNNRRPRSRARTTVSKHRDPQSKGSLYRYARLENQGSRRVPDENRRFHLESIRVCSARPRVPNDPRKPLEGT
jgi:hypothetical protein